MQRLRIQKRVAINQLLKPTPAFTRDAGGRITEVDYDYTSIHVNYEVVWAAPSGSDVTSVTQTVVDKP